MNERSSFLVLHKASQEVTSRVTFTLVWASVKSALSRVLNSASAAFVFCYPQSAHVPLPYVCL